jgi:hypothetical protein
VKHVSKSEKHEPPLAADEKHGCTRPELTSDVELWVIKKVEEGSLAA